MKQFEVAAKAADDVDNEGISFKIGERQMTAYRPTGGQMAVTLAGIGRGTDDVDRVATVINFLMAVLSENSAAYLTKRLLDRDDGLDIEFVVDVIKWLVEEWTGNPTRESSDSTPSQPSTGPESTPRTSLLT